MTRTTAARFIATVLYLLMAAVPAAIHATEFAFVTTTDYETGSSSVIWLDGSYTCDKDVASIHSDAISRFYNGLVYVVNGLGGDNIQVLDPAAGFATIRQFSTGNGSNPKDIAFLTETKAYITRYETNDLWIMNPANGDFLGSIDLSSFADGDGRCEMCYMYLKADMLFITVQRLDRDNLWLPAGDSYIAVVDCAADTLFDVDPLTTGTQGIQLTGTNPFSKIQFDQYTNRLYVSCVGSWGFADAGVEIVNPYTYQSEGYLLTESAAGGDINDVEIHSPGKGYAIITNASFFTELISFNPSTGSVIGTMYSPGDYVLNDIAVSPGGELFCADQTATNPGVWVYDTDSDTLLIADPIDTGLPPFDIAFSMPVTTGTEAPAFAALGQNYPNPFNPATVVPVSIDREARVRLTVYDVSGRMVKRLLDETLGAGSYKIPWNGRDGSGRAVSSGVYLLRLQSDGFISTKKAVLMR